MIRCAWASGRYWDWNGVLVTVRRLWMELRIMGRFKAAKVVREGGRQRWSITYQPLLIRLFHFALTSCWRSVHQETMITPPPSISRSSSCRGDGLRRLPCENSRFTPYNFKKKKKSAKAKEKKFGHPQPKWELKRLGRGIVKRSVSRESEHSWLGQFSGHGLIFGWYLPCFVIVPIFRCVPSPCRWVYLLKNLCYTT